MFQNIAYFLLCLCQVCAIVLYSNIHFGSIDTIQIEHRYVLNRIGQNASVHTKT